MGKVLFFFFVRFNYSQRTFNGGSSLDPEGASFTDSNDVENRFTQIYTDALRLAEIS
jgi:hypothetical protein